MNDRYVLLILLASLTGVLPTSANADESAAPEQTNEAQTEEKTAEELRREQQQLVAELAENNRELRRKLNTPEEKQKQAVPDVKDIFLPENPTRAQAKAFIDAIRKATELRESVSSIDPAIDKLASIPPEHIDLLFDEVTNRTRLYFYVENIIRKYDAQELRKGCVAVMQRSESDVALNIIVRSGWSQDIKPAIIRRLETNDGTLSLAWFQAAVEVGDPALYPKMHDAAINSLMASQFIETLAALPDYDLAKTVDACWKRAKSGKLQISSSTLALQAAELGNVDALGSLIAAIPLAEKTPYIARKPDSLRLNVQRLIDYRGTNIEVRDWYAANKDELVFDQFRRRFVVAEDF